jgi:hypothetical protein
LAPKGSASNLFHLFGSRAEFESRYDLLLAAKRPGRSRPFLRYLSISDVFYSHCGLENGCGDTLLSTMRRKARWSMHMVTLPLARLAVCVKCTSSNLPVTRLVGDRMLEYFPHPRRQPSWRVGPAQKILMMPDLMCGVPTTNQCLADVTQAQPGRCHQRLALSETAKICIAVSGPPTHAELSTRVLRALLR